MAAIDAIKATMCRAGRHRSDIACESDGWCERGGESAFWVETLGVGQRERESHCGCGLGRDGDSHCGSGRGRASLWVRVRMSVRVVSGANTTLR